MRTLLAAIWGLLLAAIATAQKTVSFPTEDGGVVVARNSVHHSKQYPSQVVFTVVKRAR